jgi:hypothetical protein
MYRVPANIVKQILSNQNQSRFMSPGTASPTSAPVTSPANTGFNNYQSFIGTQAPFSLFSDSSEGTSISPQGYTDSELADHPSPAGFEVAANALWGTAVPAALSMFAGPLVAGGYNTLFNAGKGEYGKAAMSATKTGLNATIPGISPYLGIFGLLDTAVKGITGKDIISNIRSAFSSKSDYSPGLLSNQTDEQSSASEEGWGYSPNNNTIGNMDNDPAMATGPFTASEDTYTIGDPNYDPALAVGPYSGYEGDFPGESNASDWGFGSGGDGSGDSGGGSGYK